MKPNRRHPGRSAIEAVLEMNRPVDVVATFAEPRLVELTCAACGRLVDQSTLVDSECVDYRH